MHNLLSGPTKKMATMWTNSFTVGRRTLPPMITPVRLKEMKQDLDSKFLLPPSHAVSSIAKKIAIGERCSHFKADEWANWLLVLSPYLLSQRLGKVASDHWMLLVKASRLFLLPCLTFDTLDKAQDLLKSFLVGFEAIYKDNFLITANFHNALHLKETIMDYSASPSHWLFNFERYNQDLKTIRTNRKDCVERTYMTKFLMQVHGQEYANAFLPGIPQENRKQVQEMFVGASNSCADLLLEDYQYALNSFCLNDFNDLATGTTFASGSECLPP